MGGQVKVVGSLFLQLFLNDICGLLSKHYPALRVVQLYR